MKRFILTLAVTLVLGLAGPAGFVSPAFAHYLGYNSANSSGRIVYVETPAVLEDALYHQYVADSQIQWNNARSTTASAGAPFFVRDAATPDTPTLTIRFDNTMQYLGTYNHEPGAARDYISINKSMLASYSFKQKKKTVTHELGHADGLAHASSTAYCDETVMTPSSYCYDANGDPYLFATAPGPHDHDDIRYMSQQWYHNGDSAPRLNPKLVDKIEYAVLGGKKVKAAETRVNEKTGAFEILEYPLPVVFK